MGLTFVFMPKALALAVQHSGVTGSFCFSAGACQLHRALYTDTGSLGQRLFIHLMFVQCRVSVS